MKKFIGRAEIDEAYLGLKFKNGKKRDKLRRLNVIKRGRGAKNFVNQFLAYIKGTEPFM